MDKKILEDYGIDYCKGMHNCMQDEAFYSVFLSMFLDDTCFLRGKAAYESGDWKEFFGCMHELKGVSGNAALRELHNAVIPLVEQLRKEDEVVREDIKPLFDAVEHAYTRTVEGIRRAR